MYALVKKDTSGEIVESVVQDRYNNTQVVKGFTPSTGIAPAVWCKNAMVDHPDFTIVKVDYTFTDVTTE